MGSLAKTGQHDPKLRRKCLYIKTRRKKPGGKASVNKLDGDYLAQSIGPLIADLPKSLKF
ncbi:hypothetical protein NQ317_002984 [Molorchus minor]|uniref:Uncharacterized protein n=1 Tax=Molorchus minor TaxID=1323400 RepID=A0ABQ9J733_9CUCU|nr:hypothetical protein NQ317_002984 [Molorchus minor]